MEVFNCLKLEKTIEESKSDTLIIQWNLDDSHIAVGCSDGILRLYTSNTGKVVRNLILRSSGDSESITSLRWRPSQSKTQNVLFGTTNNGTISQ